MAARKITRGSPRDHATPGLTGGSPSGMRYGGVESDADAHSADEHEGALAHVLPVKLLLGIFGVLMALTVLTVSVTSFDLGSSANLTVAMVIATIKATLVIAVFMHLFWDRRFNLLLLVTCILFVLLFITLSLNDRAEYQPYIDQLQAAKAAAAQ